MAATSRHNLLVAASSRIEAQAGSPNHEALIAADAGVSAGDGAGDFAFLLTASASSARARQSRRVGAASAAGFQCSPGTMGKKTRAASRKLTCKTTWARFENNREIRCA